MEMEHAVFIFYFTIIFFVVIILIIVVGKTIHLLYFPFLFLGRDLSQET